jgi:hypothetical protein
VQERDIQALQTGNNNDRDFLEVIRLPQDCIHNPAFFGIVACFPPAIPPKSRQTCRLSRASPLTCGSLTIINSQFWVLLPDRRFDRIFDQVQNDCVIDRVRLQATDRPCVCMASFMALKVNKVMCHMEFIFSS